jgi:putative membrane protein
METASIRLLALVAALGLSFGVVIAQNDMLARADRKFIQDAAGSGMFEVEIARLAESKASSADVKDFATTLAKDHSKANDELAQLAKSKKVELPPAPPRGKRKDIEKMAKLTGSEFDQRFMREVGIKDHEKDIEKFEQESAKAKDPDLKAWVDKTLPTLREHLAMAQKMPSVKKSGS